MGRETCQRETKLRGDASRDERSVSCISGMRACRFSRPINIIARIRVYYVQKLPFLPDQSVRLYKIIMYVYHFLCLYQQLLVSISAALSLIQCYSEYWFITKSILFFVGRWGSFSWTAMVAVGLCLVRCRGDDGVRKFKWWIILCGWGYVQ